MSKKTFKTDGQVAPSRLTLPMEYEAAEPVFETLFKMLFEDNEDTGAVCVQIAFSLVKALKSEDKTIKRLIELMETYRSTKEHSDLQRVLMCSDRLLHYFHGFGKEKQLSERFIAAHLVKVMTSAPMVHTVIATQYMLFEACALIGGDAVIEACKGIIE